MGAGHGHGHAGARHRWRLAVAFGLVASFFGVELVVGLVSGSLALISDAGHMAADVVALGAALVATTIATRPDDTGPDDARPDDAGSHRRRDAAAHRPPPATRARRGPRRARLPWRPCRCPAGTTRAAPARW